MTGVGRDIESRWPPLESSLSAFIQTPEFKSGLIDLRRRLKDFPGGELSHVQAVYDALADALVQEMYGSEHPLTKFKSFPTKEAWWKYVFVAAKRSLLRDDKERLRAVPLPDLELHDPDVKSPLEIVLGEEQSDLIAHEISQLPAAEQKVLELFQQGHTQAAISRKTGVDQRTVSRLYQSGISTMRKRLSR